MPIYQYICQKCGYSWDKLIKSSPRFVKATRGLQRKSILKAKNAKLKCPRCASKKVEKMIANFVSFGISGCSSNSCNACPGCK